MAEPLGGAVHKYKLFKNDIPQDIDWGGTVAVDTETLGLVPVRDRLCVVQLCSASGEVFIVQMERYDSSPNLIKLFDDENVLKVFHFARFDLAVLRHYLRVLPYPIYCTKVASKLARMNTERHSLPELCQFFLGERLIKEQQKSDWGAKVLTEQQLAYAASDVIHLHAIREKLNVLLEREDRVSMAVGVFEFLRFCADLDLDQTDYRYLIEH